MAGSARKHSKTLTRTLLVIFLLIAFVGVVAGDIVAGETPESETIEGSYIVELDVPEHGISAASLEDQRMNAQDALEDAEVDVKAEFSNAYQGFHVEDVDAQEKKQIENNPNIGELHPDYRIEKATDDSREKTGADTAQSGGIAGYDALTGNGVTIAVLDTGIKYTHQDFGECDNIESLGEDCKITGGYDYVNDEDDFMDDNGHGTHVASTAAASGEGEITGFAPDAELHGYKVLDEDGSGSMSDLMHAVDDIVKEDGEVGQNDVDIITMSLGSFGFDHPIEDAIENAVEQGFVVTAAAGNTNQFYDGWYLENINSPGHMDEVITVGASVHDGEDIDPADFSSAGPFVYEDDEGDMQIRGKPDLLAPGVDIKAAHIDQDYKELDGTSMSTPMVAGASALVLEEYPDYDTEDVKSVLMHSSSHVPLEGGEEIVGGGIEFVTGAGEMNIPASFEQPRIDLEPATVTFEPARGSITKEFTVENPGDEELTLEFSLESDKLFHYSDGQDVGVEFANGNQITLGEDEQKTVQLDIQDNGEPGYYSNTLSFTAENTENEVVGEYQTPAIWFRLDSSDVNVDVEDDTDTTPHVGIYDNDESQFTEDPAQANHDSILSLDDGSYTAVAFQLEDEPYLLFQDFTLDDESKDITLDPEEADNTVTLPGSPAEDYLVPERNTRIEMDGFQHHEEVSEDKHIGNVELRVDDTPEFFDRLTASHIGYETVFDCGQESCPDHAFWDSVIGSANTAFVEFSYTEINSDIDETGGPENETVEHSYDTPFDLSETDPGVYPAHYWSDTSPSPEYPVAVPLERVYHVIGEPGSDDLQSQVALEKDGEETYFIDGGNGHQRSFENFPLLPVIEEGSSGLNLEGFVVSGSEKQFLGEDQEIELNGNPDSIDWEGEDSDGNKVDLSQDDDISAKTPFAASTEIGISINTVNDFATVPKLVEIQDHSPVWDESWETTLVFNDAEGVTVDQMDANESIAETDGVSEITLNDGNLDTSIDSLGLEIEMDSGDGLVYTVELHDLAVESQKPELNVESSFLKDSEINGSIQHGTNTVENLRMEAELEGSKESELTNSDGEFAFSHPVCEQYEVEWTGSGVNVEDSDTADTELDGAVYHEGFDAITPENENQLWFENHAPCQGEASFEFKEKDDEDWTTLAENISFGHEDLQIDETWDEDGFNTGDKIEWRLTVKSGEIEETAKSEFDINNVFSKLLYPQPDEVEEEDTEVQLYDWFGLEEKTQEVTVEQVGEQQSMDVDGLTFAHMEHIYSFEHPGDNYWISIEGEQGDQQFTGIEHIYENETDLPDSAEGFDTDMFTDEYHHDVTVDVGNHGDINDNIDIRLKRMDRENRERREPFLFSPPVPEKTLGSEDEKVVFEDVVFGDYSVELVGTQEYQIDMVDGGQYDDYRQDVRVGEEDENITIEVEDEVETVTGTVTQSPDPENDYRYGFGAISPDGDLYMTPTVGEPDGTELVLPTPGGVQNYDLGILALELDESGVVKNSRIVFKEETVEDGNNHFDFEFEQTVTVEGNVTREDNGEGIEGAYLDFEGPNLANTQTDEGGDYSVELVEDGEYNVYIYWPEGKNKEITGFTQGESDTGFELDPGDEITLDIDNGDDTKVAVGVENFEENYFQHGQVESQIELSGLDLETNLQDYRVRAEVVNQPGYQVKRTDLDELSDNGLEDGDSVTVELQEEEPVTVEGEVVDASQEGVEANVTILDFNREVANYSVSDEEDGQYSVEVPPGYYEIRVEDTDQNYDSERVFHRIREDRTGGESIDIELASVEDVSITVENAIEDPIKGAELFFKSETSRHFTDAVTDQSGSAEVELREGQDYTLRARHPDYLMSETSITGVDSETSLDLTLSTSDTMQGTIENEDGQAVNGVIHVGNDVEGIYSSSEFEDGDYEITGLDEEQDYRVYIRARDPGLEDKVARDVNFDTEEYENFTLDFNEGHELVVDVVDENTGTEIEDARVITGYTSEITDENGEIDFGALPQGETRIEVHADGYKSHRETVEVHDPNSFGADEVKEITVDLEKSETRLEADLTVTDDGDAVEEAMVVMKANTESQRGNSVTDSGGEATIDNLVEGDYEVFLALDEDETGSAIIGESISDGGSYIETISIEGTDYDVNIEVSEE